MIPYSPFLAFLLDNFKDAVSPTLVTLFSVKRNVTNGEYAVNLLYRYELVWTDENLWSY